MAVIEALCISTHRGTQKEQVAAATFVPDWGIEGDAHAGHWHRQVSLLASEQIEAFRARGADVGPGAFGENMVVRGIDFARLPVGTRLQSGTVLLELTQIGKECHQHCTIYQAVGDCIMPRQGAFAKVLEGGTLHVGDELVVVQQAGKRPYQAAVITLSDKGSRGERHDESGPALAACLREAGYDVVETLLLADEAGPLQQHLRRLADQRQVDLILTTGGTGLSPRDITPEATLAVADKQVPGISEALRAASLAITPRAMLSRGVSVIRKKTLIINFPGSTKACREYWAIVADVLPHGLDILRGTGGDCGR
ncbi:MOSC domain-containing protein [uncultured Megasphaera sp.]|uniref:MOSC domain-containing protein n=1 Tax=uncultured Megasphaera sp. TaxID=165188 RepID=UPI00266E93D0|nr:MOSC domain-containing protein [uncultured Megasphaera sp.]